ncbi:MAG: methyltransferase domain-containing protein [Leptospiraceae bacterium]|nr:methyltransferase domain-containing protein [Leptospiraceae bacterium]MDW8305964.1 methyltransferase domain-containing protein [Leptospiraceae bacterium]
MDALFWNKRYDTEEYIYGEKPNAYFAEKLPLLKPGKILLPAEGEGRNAVYAASLGWEVFAFDQSQVAQRKAWLLAQKNQVKIRYEIAFLEEMPYSGERFEAIGLFFVHLPPLLRKRFHQKLEHFLQSNGYLILEAFGKRQLQYSSGGPREISYLFSPEELIEDFSYLEILELRDEIRLLDEGSAHQGEAHLISLFAKKPRV